MIAVTLHQLYADCIADDHKTNETRSWMASRKAWGKRIAIHASRRPVPRGHIHSHAANALAIPANAGMKMVEGGQIIAGRFVALGAVVATAILKDCVKVETEEKWGCVLASLPPDSQQRGQTRMMEEIETDLLGDYRIGRWIWRLEDVRRCHPVYARGSQRLWTLSDEDSEKVESNTYA